MPSWCCSPPWRVRVRREVCHFRGGYWIYLVPWGRRPNWTRRFVPLVLLPRSQHCTPWRSALQCSSSFGCQFPPTSPSPSLWRYRPRICTRQVVWLCSRRWSWRRTSRHCLLPCEVLRVGAEMLVGGVAPGVNEGGLSRHSFGVVYYRPCAEESNEQQKKFIPNPR